MDGKIRQSSILQAPFIKVKVKVTQPGYTNGIPNIKEEDRYILAPSAKKIGTYIRNQLFGSDLVTQTEGLDINWLMPTLGQALEEAIYDKESFIYIHKFDNKVYLECLRKCDLHNLKQKYDKIYSCDIIQDFETDKNLYSLNRHIEQKEDGTSIITMNAFEKIKGRKDEWIKIELSRFNSITGSDYKRVYNLPYHPLVNIDVGQEFFKDSKVRDENGNLLTMYHGTIRGGFNTFNRPVSAWNKTGKGFYFTNDIEYSNTFEGIDRKTGKYYPHIQEGIDKGDLTPKTYEVYLDGASAFIEIYNDNNTSGKELIIFRDSFGSSITPLLIPYYSKITVIDNRYMMSDFIKQSVVFDNQDVLFLYSTLIVNNSGSLKG